MPSFQRILVAVDESKASCRAIAYVADMIGERSGFQVGLFHLEAPPHMLEWGGSEDVEEEDRVETERGEIYREMEETVIHKGESLLARSQAILARRGIEATALPVQWEEPLDNKNLTHDILRKAREGGYGTVVVGRKSWSGWKRLFRQHLADALVSEGKGLTIWVVE
jgi:hypothetical protein